MTRSSQHPWATVAVLALGGTVASLQFSLAIPLAAQFPVLLETSPENASWLLTSTMLVAAVSTPVMARAADMYGKRRILLIALGVLTAGSFVCAVGESFGVVLAGRTMQGISACLVAVGISLLRDVLPPERTTTGVALMSATLGVGAALGLPMSGIISQHLGWHAVFWFSGLSGVLLSVAMIVFVRESPVRTPGRFDIAGALILVGSLLAILLPITKGSSWGWTSPHVLVTGASGLVGLSLWIPYELRTNHPTVDLRTAARRPVLLTNVASLFVGFAMFVNLLVSMQWLEISTDSGYGQGLSASEAGLAMVPTGLAMVAISPFSGAILNRWGGRATLILGSSIMCVTYLGRAVFSGSVIAIIGGATLVGMGTAIAFAAMPTLIMASVPITETAAANGLNSLARALGSTLSAAVVGAVLAQTAAQSSGVNPVSSELGLRVAFVLATASTLTAVAFAWFIPSKPALTYTGALVRRAGETVVSGQIFAADDTAMTTPAVVTVLDLEGTQIDWSRADNVGRYSVALPGPGSYVFVANAQGWIPAASVLEFDGDTSNQVLKLSDELTLSGRVHMASQPCASAVVALDSLDGVHLTSTRCDASGAYSFPLPGVGRYMITAFDPATGAASANKALFTFSSCRIDFDLGGSAAPSPDARSAAGVASVSPADYRPQ